ncbi:uncharacterized protein LOC117644923 [Thrips palmi]|uniref:Uncharacterized protein LOC117644923 n=1 Tax=Thrips palmi TaxID=161013 RepID=A0A6P8YTU3_THRPL|nr:uncharacterized protein LOC117644923 [Thrips palmi]
MACQCGGRRLAVRSLAPSGLKLEAPRRRRESPNHTASLRSSAASETLHVSSPLQPLKAAMTNKDTNAVAEVADAAGMEVVEATAVDAADVTVYVALDVSGSIRGDVIYPSWVMNDLKNLQLPAGRTKWILWGTTGEFRDSLDDVLEYLKDQSKHLCGNEPICFLDKMPPSGVVDLHVYTDGEIDEYSVTDARRRLATHGQHLRFREVVVNYVNSHLEQMNVGLSAIFDGYVLEMHRTRVAQGGDKKLIEFAAVPISETVTAVDILDQYIGLGKSEADMTTGVHYLAQRFANASPAARRDIRRLVKERVDAVIEEHRVRRMAAEEEKALLDAVANGDWAAAKKPFVGHAVSDDVKMVQGYCQRFLNETKHGSLIRVSAYAPMVLKRGAGEQFDEQEEVLLDHIMFLGMGKNAVIVMPAQLDMPNPPDVDKVRGKSRAARMARLAARRRLFNTPIKCALAVNVKANFDNTFGLDTLFSLRDQQHTDGVSDVANPWQAQDEEDEQPERRPFNFGEFLQGLQAGAHLRKEDTVAAVDVGPEALSSGAYSFGVNPFTRQHMDCVLLVPASAESLPADRLAQVDAWNAHMLSRFVRGGRSMPSVALSLALVLEKAFAAWKTHEMARPEDRAEAEKLRAVWRRYVGGMATPLTFTVGLPVIIKGTFATAARLACAVLQAALDPRLPLDVLTQFWWTQSEEDAAKVWDALRVYAGPAFQDQPFPRAHFRTLSALMSGVQYSKSGRDARLRAKKGRSYSVRMYTKRLDQLAAAGCHPDRLAHEEKAVRKDLTGVAEAEPLLCVHGVEVDKCRPLEGQQHDTLCAQTCRPTLLNKATMDMWYVGLPEDTETLALESFHKAMWQLARKRNKGGRMVYSQFPPPERKFEDYVNHRVRAAWLLKDPANARVLPTAPCARLAQDIALTYHSYVELAQRKPNMTCKKFVKALKARREVCEFDECCQFIREAATTDERRAWIDAHSTLEKVAGNKDVLSGKVSYRTL